MRVLIVEDDPILADGLSVGLKLHGVSAEVVGSCADGRHALAAGGFDAVVLDVMLPDGSGLDLLTSLRQAGDESPILLLTALDETRDRIAGLDRGADDYLGKPFDLDELAARLRAVVRRREGRAIATLAAAGLVLDPASHSAARDGVAIDVTRREFAILRALAERPGLIRSRIELEERLYGWQEDIESNAIEVHIHNLRQKIGREQIETVRGLGYRLRMAP
ncbi:response regulator transcription factor [Bosea sp. TND4EK4]|uniref:response regulator n=1 Tax=Bosea sp. TND4EK4 TaxID=1907408 RepID=UPI0009539CF9|nr:response regulator transcription factor [Bosea sp. TND4EK4]SIR59260.1 two component transcriptional regulator, winged helix family [Bosea sp. TND4EK4]